MYKAATEYFPHADAAILCAAVADFKPATTADSKIKREKDDLLIQLTPTKDIAAELGKMKKDNQVMVGFALETDNEQANAQSKLQRKNLDFIVLNSLRTEGAGFRGDTNVVTLIDKERSEELPLMSKREVAERIVDKIENFL